MIHNAHPRLACRGWRADKVQGDWALLVRVDYFRLGVTQKASRNWAAWHAANPILSYPVPFGAGVLFGDDVSQRPGIFVVRDLSYYAARITRGEDRVRNVAGDYAARTDDRP